MPLGISTAFDQNYACNTCDLTDMDRDEHLDRRTWRCKTCNKPVQIYLENENGDSYLVERLQACELKVGQFITLEYDISQGAFEVLASEPAMGKGNKWYVAFRRLRGQQVERDTHYNRII